MPVVLGSGLLLFSLYSVPPSPSPASDAAPRPTPLWCRPSPRLVPSLDLLPDPPRTSPLESPLSVAWPCHPPASIQYSLDGGLVRPRGLADPTFFCRRVRKVGCRPEIDRRQVLGTAGRHHCRQQNSLSASSSTLLFPMSCPCALLSFPATRMCLTTSFDRVDSVCDPVSITPKTACAPKSQQGVKKEVSRNERQKRRGGRGEGEAWWWDGRVVGGAAAAASSSTSSSGIKINSWNSPTHHSSHRAGAPISTQPKYTKVNQYTHYIH